MFRFRFRNETTWISRRDHASETLFRCRTHYVLYFCCQILSMLVYLCPKSDYIIYIMNNKTQSLTLAQEAPCTQTSTQTQILSPSQLTHEATTSHGHPVRSRSAGHSSTSAGPRLDSSALAERTRMSSRSWRRTRMATCTPSSAHASPVPRFSARSSRDKNLDKNRACLYKSPQIWITLYT